ncbi:protein NETWORKED 1D isoform X3 [Plutella xylostella]|uniref:protein NETWORKED 1D isoform X3 n=1 Tax=Plutella xylostella TaxID=51655 RepID=UPI00203242CE|nr:protein NETWORKED 1D isoform X3 [Plutella xylostella]
MAAVGKCQKDKPAGRPSPVPAPRPTAASAARAARNATNRSLAQAKERPKNSPSNVGKAKTSPQAHTKDKSDPVQISPAKQPDEVINNTIPDQHANEEIETFVVARDYIINTIDEISESHNTGNSHQELPDIEADEAEVNNISRPPTPKVPEAPKCPSRPRTPKLPEAPKCPSRPQTPVHPGQNSNVSSRPNTPLRASSWSKNHSSVTIPRLNSAKSAIPEPCNKEPDLKAVYAAQHQQFNTMKKELDTRQQAILELFDNLQGLRMRMDHEGIPGSGEGVQVNDLVLLNVTDWASDEVARLYRDALAAHSPDDAIELVASILPYDENSLAELDERLTNLPVGFVDLCLEAITTRQEIIDWVKEDLIEIHDIKDEDVMERIATFNTQGLELCEALRGLKHFSDNIVGTMKNLSNRVFQERSALVSVGETLVREIERLRLDISNHAAALAELQKNQSVDTRRELEEERAARHSANSKLSNLEPQLRQAKLRISKMDRQLKEAEASIASLTGTVKSLEDQSRQRESILEGKARKLRESLRTTELANNQTLQQRNALQTEVQELKEQISKMTEQHKSVIKELNSEVKELKTLLDEQKARFEAEELRNKEADEKIAASQACIEALKAKITEMEESRPNPELPTEREMELWSELHATKETLRVAEDEVTACKREKIRFLETLTKITKTEDKVGIQQKLAAELVTKEEIIDNMQRQIRELSKNVKLNEHKVMQYEQYVRDLQANNTNNQGDSNGYNVAELEQEILHLKMAVLDANHQNDALAEQLLQKEQQIDQQEKTSKAQGRVIKIREELIGLLKGKEAEQARRLAGLQADLDQRMKLVDEVNQQIAGKADEIQELFSTLETKQQQIRRLEKIVLALEEQQRRAQAQRTRHEEKIAALEHELAAGGRRERFLLQKIPLLLSPCRICAACVKKVWK